MATWLYKDGEEILVDALEVEHHVISGWSTEKNPKPKAAPKPAEKKIKPKSE